MATDFGKDTLCIDSLKTGRLASGVRLVAQRCYHRLVTPRGMLRGGQHEFNFGLDLAGFVGNTDARTVTYSIGPMIENELLKDPQVQAVETTVIATTTVGLTSWTIEVDAQTAEGPFDMVLSVSSLTVELVELNP